MVVKVIYYQYLVMSYVPVEKEDFTGEHFDNDLDFFTPDLLPLSFLRNGNLPINTSIL